MRDISWVRGMPCAMIGRWAVSFRQTSENAHFKLVHFIVCKSYTKMVEIRIKFKTMLHWVGIQEECTLCKVLRNTSGAYDDSLLNPGEEKWAGH